MGWSRTWQCWQTNKPNHTPYNSYWQWVYGPFNVFISTLGAVFHKMCIGISGLLKCSQFRSDAVSWNNFEQTPPDYMCSAKLVLCYYKIEMILIQPCITSEYIKINNVQSFFLTEDFPSKIEQTREEDQCFFYSCCLQWFP